MGVDFFLACGDCCEFIYLHKWPVVEDGGAYLVHAHYEPDRYPGQLRPEDSPYPFVDLDTRCKKVLVTSGRLDEALDGEVPDQPYIRRLTPIVRAFAERHRGHRIFLSCDLGDPEEEPWWPGPSGFANWLEVGGEIGFYRYLPRFLVEVEGCPTWPDVLARMSGEWPFAYPEQFSAEIEAIRWAFDRCRASRGT